MKKIILAFLLSLVMTSVASAHVVVTPNQVNTNSVQTFDTHVPAEMDVPATALRLLIPSGLKNVTPTPKLGWTITTKKNGDEVTEIDWTGGTIAVNTEDDFIFVAQVPSRPTTLDWKAYLTYQDGTIDSFDKSPSQVSGDEDPYSETVIVGTPSKINLYLDIGTAIVLLLVIGYFIHKKLRVKVEFSK